MAVSDVQPVVAIGGELREPLYPTMNTLRLIRLVIIRLIKQAWLLPQSVSNTAKQRRRQVVRNEREAERLDRIRNPSKYLGR